MLVEHLTLRPRLSISSQIRSDEQQAAQNGTITEESTYSGAFDDSFTLPGPVNASGMKSDFNNGVLTLTIPKAVS